MAPKPTRSLPSQLFIWALFLYAGIEGVWIIKNRLEQNSETRLGSEQKKPVEHIQAVLNAKNATRTETGPRVASYTPYVLQQISENSDFNEKAFEMLEQDKITVAEALKFNKGIFKIWHFQSTVEIEDADGSKIRAEHYLILKTDVKDKILKAIHYEADEWAAPPMRGLLCRSKPIEKNLKPGLKTSELGFQSFNKASSLCSRRFRSKFLPERVLDLTRPDKRKSPSSKR